MRKVLLIAGVCLAVISPNMQAFAEDTENTPCEITVIEEQRYDYSAQLLEKIKLQRDSIYNALNLTPSQIKCKNEIDKKRYEELMPQLKKLCYLNRKIEAAGQSGDIGKVKAIQNEYKPVKKCIRSISEKYDKEFMKILNSSQKEKYRMIRKLKRTDLKKQQKIQQNGKKQSDLRPFGEKISQPAYTEKMKKENSLWNKIKCKCKKSGS